MTLEKVVELLKDSAMRLKTHLFGINMRERASAKGKGKGKGIGKGKGGRELTHDQVNAIKNHAEANKRTFGMSPWKKWQAHKKGYRAGLCPFPPVK